MHDHDTHPLDRMTGPAHVERFRLLQHPGETLAVACHCALGADHDNTVRPDGPAPGPIGRRSLLTR